MSRAAFEEAFRMLLLPIAPDQEKEAMDRVEALLATTGYDPQDVPLVIQELQRQWMEQDDLQPVLKSILQAALQNESWIKLSKHPDNSAASAYLDCIGKLRTKFEFSVQTACQYLSHLNLIAELAKNQRMSAARICQTLQGIDSRVDFHWKSMSDMLRLLYERPCLKRDEVEILLSRDKVLEESTFNDSDLKTACNQVAKRAISLSYPDDLESKLVTLYGLNSERPFYPYLQILHFISVTLEFWDHRPQVLYEFAPRGKKANYIYQVFPDDLDTRVAPFLNNAKAHDELTESWVYGRDRYLPEAKALLSIVEGLNQMGYPGRRSLAAAFRHLNLRVIRLHTPQAVQLAQSYSLDAIQGLITAVTQAETHTNGIIEQRLIDFATALLHPRTADWKPRGLSDPVNASNLSQKKLGDCDFQQASTHTCIAYEPHAGVLTSPYLDSHKSSLKRILPIRAEEWSSFSEPNQWKVKVRFIAHSYKVLRPAPEHLFEVEVTHSLETYGQFFAQLNLPGLDPHLVANAFRIYFVEPINSRRTPLAVREVALRLLAG